MRIVFNGVCKNCGEKISLWCMMPEEDCSSARCKNCDAEPYADAEYERFRQICRKIYDNIEKQDFIAVKNIEVFNGQGGRSR